MVQVTTDGIVKWTNGDPTDLVVQSQAQGDSIQAALDKRERFDFVWPTSTERTAQTGMVQGSRGYQVDTKSEYIFDNSQWRLALPYAEFNLASVAAINSAGYVAGGALTLDSSLSTSSTMVTTPAAGRFTIVSPGIYGFSVYGFLPSGAGIGGQSQVVVSTAAAALGTQYTRGYFTGGQGAMAAMPFISIPAANTTLYISYYNDTGTSQNITSTLRIGRFG